MPNENDDNNQGSIAAIVKELQLIIADKNTSTADKLKAIAMKIDVLGLRSSAAGSADGGSVAYDASRNEAMQDPALRKRAAKLEEDTQRAIERKNNENSS